MSRECEKNLNCGYLEKILLAFAVFPLFEICIMFAIYIFLSPANAEMQKKEKVEVFVVDATGMPTVYLERYKNENVLFIKRQDPYLAEVFIDGEKRYINGININLKYWDSIGKKIIIEI